jgi:replication-associated recombination protein RarA
MARQMDLEETLPTANGFNRDEVKSALQKSIRRGLEEDALYWAVELSHLPTKGMDGFEHVWRRLKTIASEDVGLASPAAVQVRALYENWKEAEGGEAQLFLVHAVLLLARAKKSRLVDHATILAFKGGLAKRDMPDYAKDKHTAVGRAIGRGFKQFFEEGTKLANQADVEDPYEARAKKLLLKSEGR